MHQESIFSFSEYRPYLVSRFSEAKPGHKTSAAKALGVHTSLLPQVLKGSCELSLEQAEKFNSFFGHEEEEANFFLLLVLKSRAGTEALRQRLDQQLQELAKKQSQISARLAKEKAVSEKDQERFYSSYLYAAIHVLSSIPSFSSIEMIAKALAKTEGEIRRAVTFLESIGIVEFKDGKLIPGNRHVHLPPESPLIVNHHLNWRMKSLERIRENPKKDLHYSGVLSLSEGDAQKIKTVLVDAIARSTDIAVKSPEETAYVLCVDFFQLIER
jgi:uncharacterized protein (TIGR02147 family)